MIVEEKFSGVHLMGDGLRYKRKRKFKDLNQVQKENKEEERNNIMEEPNPDEERIKKGKKLKVSKNKENLIKQKEEQIKKKEEHETIPNKVNKEPPITKVKNYENMTLIEKEKELNDKVTNPLNLPVSENKRVYLKELERIRTTIQQYEDYFNNESLPLMVDKLKACCIKNARTLKDLKQLLVIDSLIESQNAFKGLLAVDYPNVGNILLCYFSEVTIIKIINALLPIIEANADKHCDVIVIKLRNIENLLNQNKQIGLSQFNKLLKETYVKMVKSDKNIKRGKQISNEYDNIIFEEMINIYSQNTQLKNIQVFNFESLQDVFSNNPRYVDFQIKKSDVYHKIIKYAHEEVIQNNQNKLNLRKVREELISSLNEYSRKLSDLHVFYANTSELIKDFLDS